jgi:hypothetical protein
MTQNTHFNKQFFLLGHFLYFGLQIQNQKKTVNMDNEQKKRMLDALNTPIFSIYKNSSTPIKDLNSILFQIRNGVCEVKKLPKDVLFNEGEFNETEFEEIDHVEETEDEPEEVDEKIDDVHDAHVNLNLNNVEETNNVEK